MNKPPLPKESESQRIGHVGLRAFTNSLPTSWRDTRLDGDADVGLDVLIQVVSDAKYAFAFLAQVKASTADKANAERSYFSVPLKVSTANYYRRVGRPIMLVFADLSTGKEAQSPVYYAWIQDQLAETLDALEPGTSGNSEVTFQVPAANRLDPKLDVAPYLENLSAEQLSLEDLQRAISGASQKPMGVGIIQRVTENVLRGGASYLESLEFTSDQPWADPEPGTLTWQLKQANDSITNGNSEAARSILNSLSDSDFSDAAGKAELEFQLGRFESLTSGLERAQPHHEKAYKLQPQKARYLCAKYETQLNQTLDEESATKIYGELTSNSLSGDPAVKALRARCLMLQGKYAEASNLLDDVPSRHAVVERAICLYLQRRPEAVAALVDAADPTATGRHTILSLRIIALRAQFDKTFRTATDSFIPASGPAGVSAEELQSLWEEVRKLAKDLQANGWPLNSQIIIDVVMSSGLAVGRADETLVLLDDFVRARPQFAELQISRMKVAMFADRHETALDAVSKIPNASTRAVHQVLVRYEMQDFSGVCKHIPELLAIENDSEEFFRDALAVSAHAARSVFDLKQATQCIDRLRLLADSGPTMAIYDFVTSASAGDRMVLGSSIARLIEAYEKWPDSRAIQDQLFHALRPKVADEAKLATTIAIKIQDRRQLFGREVAHLCLCLRELGRLDDAVKLLDEARARLPSDITIPALLAMILEDKGDAGRAMAVLETLLSGSRDAPEFARSVYINIAARNGLIESAVVQFQALLNSRSAKDDKREIYRALFSLELHRMADAERAVALAFQYGAHSDSTDERQEGMFLQMVTMCRTVRGCTFTPQQQDQFNSRCQAFLTTHPNSKFFSALQVSDGTKPEELFLAMRKKLGITEERLTQLQKLVVGLQRGTDAIPYAWRPQRLLLNVASLPHLWEITKRTDFTSGEYHLLVYREATQPRDLRRLDKFPLIDFITLLIASDLGILDLLIKLYGRIAVAKSTLLKIQYEVSHLGFHTESLLKLREALTTRIDHIVQPGLMPDEDGATTKDETGETKELLSQSQFVQYSDDACIRWLVLGEERQKEGLTTPDVLESAENAGLLSTVEAARLYAKLADWNIGHVPLQYRHFVAAIPKTVDRANNVIAKIEVLFAYPVFRAFTDALWDHGKPYKDVHTHAASIISKMLTDNPSVDEQLLAAIISIWLDKVSLRDKPKFGKTHHLANVFLGAFMKLDAPALGSQHLWSAYKLVLERTHGNRMDEPKLREALELLGGVLAALPNQRPEMTYEAGDLVERLLSTIGSESREAKWLDAAYQKERAEAARREVAATGSA
jgi:hypothetical protein